MNFNADHAVGVLFVVAGGVAVFLGLDYGFGTLSEMGPGALPVLLGATLLIFGAVLLVQATMAGAGGAPIELMPREEVRPFIAILAALLAFGLLVDHLGLLPSLVALIVVGWLADRTARVWQLPILAGAIVAIIVAIFYFGLGIPFHLFDWSF